MPQSALSETLTARTARGFPIYLDPADPLSSETVATHGVPHASALDLWNAALVAQPWQLVASIDPGNGWTIIGSHMPLQGAAVAIAPDSASTPFLKRSLDEFERTVELITVPDSEDSRSTGLTEARLDALKAALEKNAATSLCVRVDGVANPFDVLRDLHPLIDELDRWMVVLEGQVGDSIIIADLAVDHALYVLDIPSKKLIRVLPGTSQRVVERLLESPWIHSSGVALLSAPELSGAW